ncbi:hypothetical protein [Pseudomonas phage KP1]|uniref:DUF4055 domain-containing protein n=1 Tax=Pseudomonas phage KP1 TaxID=2562463 RepID=A0A6G5QAH2_9CAUD|nr:portal protein [Pseudomonas phage KP1]QBZ71723.1 hypothetical protein [Pseudomonas phage KP1]
MMPNVAFVRPELAKLLPLYYLIRDAIAGEPTVKAARDKYLPMPNASDKSPENKARYEAYLKRAVFYNVTRRTLFALVGQVFMRDPVIKAPTLLDPLLANATGTGINLIQLAKKGLSLNLAYSRTGLFVDYPHVEEGASVEDIQSGKIRPTMSVYSPMEIVNWRVTNRGAEEILSLVVLFETWCVQDDGFEMKHSGQFRVLRLDEKGEYIHEVWREPSPTTIDGSKVPKGNYAPYKIYKPLDAKGNRITEIPFMFIGSENNDPMPDNPNFYDLASINMAHYRNSADYEESCYIVGQPTPVLTGLTEEWVDKVLKGKIQFGSMGGIPLPVGASADLLQADANTMIKEAMDTKERQMVALGARLVEQKEVQRTATEAELEAASEGSTLASASKNVSMAFEWGLKLAARLIGQPDNAVTFELNTDFDIARMSPDERKQAIEEWQKGATTFEEMRTVLRKAGVATEDDAAAKAKIAADTAEAMAMAQIANEPGDSGNVGKDNKGGA